MASERLFTGIIGLFIGLRVVILLKYLPLCTVLVKLKKYFMRNGNWVNDDSSFLRLTTGKALGVTLKYWHLSWFYTRRGGGPLTRGKPSKILFKGNADSVRQHRPRDWD